MIAFSTSGKSNEVLEILELSRHLGVASVIGVTSHPDSELRGLSDLVLDMGIIEEPCPIGLTPSASMAVMLAIGDAIALALMEAKGVTREDYGNATMAAILAEPRAPITCRTSAPTDWGT